MNDWMWDNQYNLMYIAASDVYGASETHEAASKDMDLKNPIFG